MQRLIFLSSNSEVPDATEWMVRLWEKLIPLGEGGSCRVTRSPALVLDELRLPELCCFLLSANLQTVMDFFIPALLLYVWGLITRW